MFIINIFRLAEQNRTSNVCYFIPFYVLYTAFVPIHAQLSVTIYRIGLRYQTLNNIISDYAGAGEVKTLFNFNVSFILNSFVVVVAVIIVIHSE